MPGYRVQQMFVLLPWHSSDFNSLLDFACVHSRSCCCLGVYVHLTVSIFLLFFLSRLRAQIAAVRAAVVAAEKIPLLSNERRRHLRRALLSSWCAAAISSCFVQVYSLACSGLLACSCVCVVVFWVVCVFLIFCRPTGTYCLQKKHFRCHLPPLSLTPLGSLTIAGRASLPRTPPSSPSPATRLHSAPP